MVPAPQSKLGYAKFRLSAGQKRWSRISFKCGLECRVSLEVFMRFYIVIVSLIGFMAVGGETDHGGWVKYAGNPVLGNAKLGTCFDVNVISEGNSKYNMYFSWRPKRSISLRSISPQTRLASISANGQSYSSRATMALHGVLKRNSRTKSLSRQKIRTFASPKRRHSATHRKDISKLVGKNRRRSGLLKA